MKELIFILIFIQYVLSIPWPPKEQTIVQDVDHFTFNTPERFLQRVLYYDAYWSQPAGPILFYAGNEGNIESFWNNTGFAFELALKIKALVIFAEHRYYGVSLPFGNKSFQQPYLKYLTIEQALADYAFLLDDIKTNFKITSPVITIGGSYGGMLAAFMRFKYPNLVQGAIASSAPIYWIANEGSSRHQFFEDITKDFADVNSKCPQLVKDGYANISDLANQGIAGYHILTNAFNLCNPLRTTADINHLKLWIRDAFVSMAMVDYPYSASFMGNLPAWPVNASCQLMLKYAENNLYALREGVGLFYNTSTSTHTQTCFDIYEEYIECADPTGCGLGNDATAWDFQACTEMNLYDDTVPDPSKDMFPYLPTSAAWRKEYCMDKYDVVPNEDQMRTIFWGGNILSSSNIVFPNGDLDPWHRGGVLTNLTNTISAFLIHGGAHHLDLRSTNPQDPPSVTQCREFVTQLVFQWISEHNSKHK